MCIKNYIVTVILLLSAYVCNAQNWSKSDFEYIRHVAVGNVPSATIEEVVACQIVLMGSYMDGENGLPKDMRGAAYWAEKAAVNGDVTAQSIIAFCYKYGEGVPLDLRKALYWYDCASKQNDHQSSLDAGKMYFYGDGTSVDYTNAAKRFKDAAFGDIPEGKYYYALCFANGCGVKRDSVKTRIWAERAIQDKYYDTYWMLGKMYEEGKTVARDYDYARYLYEQGVEHEISACANNLGLGYENGTLAEKDINKALEYFQIAAEQGNRYGKANSARLYANKDLEIYDIQKAIQLYQELVQDGYEQYDSNLLYLYEQTNNKRGILEIYKKRAANGDTLAMNRLAYMYVRGEGTAPSLDNALWIIEKAIKKEPENLNFLDTKGDVYLIWGDEKKAKVIWKKIKKINPTFYDKPTEGFYTSDLNAYFVSQSK